jgi:hypothetical protein
MTAVLLTSWHVCGTSADICDHAVISSVSGNVIECSCLPRPQRRDYVYLTHGQVLALAAETGRGRLLILLLA